MIENKQFQLTESIINAIPAITELGMFFGKTGIMVYLFQLARQTGNSYYQEVAEQLIDDICVAADKMTSAGFNDGLCGVAWSIEYLAQKGFIDADTDEALEEIDNRIFKHLTTKSFDELISSSDMLPGIAFYLIWRISPYKDKDSELVKLRKDLLIVIINALETSYNKDSYVKLREEPVRFSLAEYRLPFYLYLIAEIYKLDFYNYKLDRIIESITPVILSTFPIRQSHRIYLILALRYVLQYKERVKWQSHLSLLEHSIDAETLLKEEFHNKGISLNCGMCGVLFLLKVFPMADKLSFCKPIRDGLIKNINKSDYFEKETFQNQNDMGLLLGKAGIALSLLLNDILPENKSAEENPTKE